MARDAEIKFRVKLDENKMPDEIFWEATDSETEGENACKAMLISIWDKENDSTMSIDFWTNDMLIDDMNIFFFQTMMKMADTYKRATQNEVAYQLISGAAQQFAEKLDLVKK